MHLIKKAYSDFFSKKASSYLLEFISMIQRECSEFLQSKLSLSVYKNLQNVYPSFGTADNVNWAPSS